ncbi:MAG: FAD synthetase family protein [Opitutales bacterium]|nr:FAD synthetase family protein [Opitutales bacterium]
MTVIHTFSSATIQQLRQKNIVLAIGVFDGVHIGHRVLIEQTKQLGLKVSAECAVYTFWPYPHHVYDPKFKPLIYPLSRKYKILKNLGVQHIIEQNFDSTFSKLHSEEFIQYLLNQVPLLRGICVGSDFRFGYAREDGVDALSTLCLKYGIYCKVIDKFAKDGIVVSSTHIRRLIAANDFKNAETLLGEKFSG